MKSGMRPIEDDIIRLLVQEGLARMPEEGGSDWPIFSGFRPDSPINLVVVSGGPSTSQSDTMGRNTLFQSRFQVQVRAAQREDAYVKVMEIRDFLHHHLRFVLERGGDFTRVEYQGIHTYIEPFRLLFEDRGETWAVDLTAFRREV